jgi:hypothetical protein
VSTTRRTDGGLGYEITGRRNGGGNFVPHVVLKCAKCPSRLEFPAIGKTPPEHVAKHIRGKGWQFRLGSYSCTRCPECDQKENAQRAGDSGKRMVTILGQSVAIKRELAALAPAVEGEKPARPTRNYRLLIQSDRPLIDLLRALQGYGDVINTSSEIVEEPTPGKRRSELPPRYRHPLNPQCEWSGRGRRPGWLKEFLQVPGRTIEQCLISNH